MVVDIGATVGWSHLAVKYYISGGCQILNMSGGCQILNTVVVVKYLIQCSDKVKKSYKSEEIKPEDGGRGWLDFMEVREVLLICWMYICKVSKLKLNFSRLLS